MGLHDAHGTWGLRVLFYRLSEKYPHLLENGVLGSKQMVFACLEAELSLYPGPHNYGFYPNPDFYNDNL